MSDLEDKLRSLAFREPPRDLRRQILAAAEAATVAEPGWTWRDWLWPSPRAWAALGILMSGALAFNASLSAPAPLHLPRTAASSTPGATPPVFYALQTRQQQLAWIDARH
jgi:hypothetical protein